MSTKLLIKQRVFRWSDTYDVFDKHGKKLYHVKAEIISLTHKLHVYDAHGKEVGMIKEKLISFLPAFEIEVHGKHVGRVQKKMTLLKPKYKFDANGWKAEGDLVGWHYDINKGFHKVASVRKELLHWGDTYSITVKEPEDELMALMLVLAIDASNCDDNN